MKKEKTEDQLRERREAKADINVQLRDKVRELTQEAEQIDGDIQKIEAAAGCEVDENRVVELLAERSRLLQRKEAMPFILRGTQARALRRQAAALYDEASEAKADLDSAESEVNSVTKRIPELQQQLDQAIEALDKATRRRDDLALQHNSLHRAASYTEGDAKCLEQGIPMKFEPQRFIG